MSEMDISIRQVENNANETARLSEDVSRDAEIGAGRARSAEALRSRLIAVCRKGMAEGWMDSNPAEATEKTDVPVMRELLQPTKPPTPAGPPARSGWTARPAPCRPRLAMCACRRLTMMISSR